MRRYDKLRGARALGIFGASRLQIFLFCMSSWSYKSISFACAARAPSTIYSETHRASETLEDGRKILIDTHVYTRRHWKRERSRLFPKIIRAKLARSSIMDVMRDDYRYIFESIGTTTMDEMRTADVWFLVTEKSSSFSRYACFSPFGARVSSYYFFFF